LLLGVVTAIDVVRKIMGSFSVGITRPFFLPLEKVLDVAGVTQYLGRTKQALFSTASTPPI
jgi:hypothetical protein